ncbi:Facilitated trehalose transporter Tret1-2-like protein [Armadillidium vulgare]|nr:Facilitated trehalose transporter Tret1-2-like protein [Armadillidium vulgare]
MTLGLSAPLLPLLFDDPQMDISEEEGSWIASIVPGGAILGSLASSYLLDLLGRKNLLLISMISYIWSSEKSLRALKWLLEDESKISKKFKEMEEHLNDNLSTSLNLKSYTLFDKYNRFPVTVLMLLHIFQQLTGINALIFYSTDIFEDILEIEYPEYYTMLLSLLNIISNLNILYFTKLFEKTNPC